MALLICFLVNCKVVVQAVDIHVFFIFLKFFK
ncbi:MAG: hypothetical protein ACJA0C_001337 [Candidatus Endobugula sp.]|jgi:hypothetical protein